MEQVFWDLFKNVSSIEEEFEEVGCLENAVVLFAAYWPGGYCGTALVIFERNGKLYEVNGYHCSCNGLEYQWSPEETSWGALAMRKWDSDASKESIDELNALIKERLAGQSAAGPSCAPTCS